MSTPADVVNIQLRAYNNRNVEEFAATYAEDATIMRMPESTVILRGRAEIAEYYATHTFTKIELRAEILTRAVIGKYVIDHEQAWGLQDTPKTVMVVYCVENELIQKVWFYEI